MASNGFPRAGRSGRTPHFLTVGLLVVICILAFNYWNVSSQNKILQKERAEMTRNLEELALKRVHLEKRCEALDQQLHTNNLEVQALTNDKNSCQENLRDTGDERDQYKEKLFENESEIKELRMQVEDTNATADRQKADLETLQRELDIKKDDMYRMEDVLKETEERLSFANDEIGKYQQQFLARQQQQQQQLPQQPVQNPGVPQLDRNVPPPPYYQGQPQQVVPGGLQPQQPYSGRENIPPLSANKIVVPDMPQIPQVPNVYPGMDNYQRLNVPRYDPNAVPKAGDTFNVPNLPGLPQDNVQDKFRDETNIKIEIEGNPLGANVPLDRDQQIDRPLDFEPNQDGLNKDPGMVDHIGDEGIRKEDNAEMVVEGIKDKDNNVDYGNRVVDQESEDVPSNRDNESDDQRALGNPDGGIDDGLPSEADDNIHLFRDGVQEDDNSQSESDYDFDKEDGDRDKDMMEDEQLEDDKLRFNPVQEGNHLNPVPKY